MPEPIFVVVGHPNKGKSSLVATLAQDPSVRISAEPGTTTKSRRFPMRVDGEVLYTLVDTPGFQRARSALDWMGKQLPESGGAADRPRIVGQFVEEHRGGRRFADECELLAPMIANDQPAGIIYVVDGARSYGPEYDAEMEILRWTGRPSLAVINPIGQADYVDQWQSALGQYFRVVRVLDAVKAEFEKRIELLRAFGQLQESWRAPLEEAANALIEDRRRKQRDSARMIAEMIAQMIGHTEEKKLAKDENPAPHKPELEQRYRGKLRQVERRCRQHIEQLYGHDRLDRHESEFELVDQDLLSEQTWLMFGLRKRDLLAAGATGGALAGGTFDAAVGASSFLLGAVVGGIVGGAAGYYGAQKLTDVKVINHPLGGRLLRAGPTQNANFPFVVLGRAVHHHRLISGRTHAEAGALNLSTDAQSSSEQGALNPLTETQRRELTPLFKKLRKTDPGTTTHAETTDTLTQQLQAILWRP